MKTQLAAVAFITLFIQLPVWGNPRPISVAKLDKLQPGDQLSIAFHRDPDREGGMMNLTLTVRIFEDGKIRVPFLDQVPAAGLSVLEAVQKLQDDYDTYFALPQ
jgi:protein involved in polysaccharide export with SLBB domain